MRGLALFLFVSIAVSVALWVLMPQPASAFGDVGAFDPRVLLVGTQKDAAHPSAPARWSWELIQRTSAPGRLKPSTVRADDPGIVEGPFLYWSGESAVPALTQAEIAGLRRFFSLGGLLFVDDASPESDGAPGPFGKSARQELGRVLSDRSPIALGLDHVIFRSFYLIRKPEGRVSGGKTLDAVAKNGHAQIVYGSHDLGGALARGPTGVWEFPVVPGGDAQRERATRLAVNIAMYLLCSNYKDDQVHAPFLMRRRALRDTR